MEMQISVMPTWIAGIQIRRMRPETSMSAWIPALHAGMTMRGMGSTIQCLECLIFEEAHEGHEGFQGTVTTDPYNRSEFSRLRKFRVPSSPIDEQYGLTTKRTKALARQSRNQKSECSREGAKAPSF